MTARQAEITRNTKETAIELSLNLDGAGAADINTGIGFYDHMLSHIAHHGKFDLRVGLRATCTSTPTIPSRTSPSAWAAPSTRRLARAAASSAWAPLMCRWMRRWLAPSST